MEALEAELGDEVAARADRRVADVAVLRGDLTERERDVRAHREPEPVLRIPVEEHLGGQLGIGEGERLTTTDRERLAADGGLEPVAVGQRKRQDEPDLCAVRDREATDEMRSGDVLHQVRPDVADLAVRLVGVARRRVQRERLVGEIDEEARARQHVAAHARAIDGVVVERARRRKNANRGEFAERDVGLRRDRGWCEPEREESRGERAADRGCRVHPARSIANRTAEAQSRNGVSEKF